MLYWLFEDLTSEDRERVRKSVIRITSSLPDMAAALVLGRGAISRTSMDHRKDRKPRAGEAVTFWADKAAKGESTIPAYIWGSLDALFLPQNIDTTVLTLMAPGAFKGVGALSPTAGRLLGLGLTGVGAYDATISLQQVISDRTIIPESRYRRVGNWPARSGLLPTLSSWVSGSGALAEQRRE